ncbi:MAG: hypothetical protein ACK45Z_12420, partial [Dolichospermum sp.]
MISHQEIFKEINTITEKLIEISLCDQQNFPSSTPIGKDSYQIAYSDMQDLSIALKNIDYKDIY